MILPRYPDIPMGIPKNLLLRIFALLKIFDSLAQRIAAFFRSCLSASNQRFGQLIAVDTDCMAWNLLISWKDDLLVVCAFSIQRPYIIIKRCEVSHGFFGVGWVLRVEIRYDLKICFPKICLPSGLQAFHPCLVRGWDSSSTTDVHATTDEQLEKLNSLG